MLASMRHTTFKGGGLIEAMYHLLKPVDKNATHEAIVYCGSQRYGGFRDAEHAAFFIREMGWERDAEIRIVAVTDGP